MTLVKQECDIIQATSVLIILKNWENNRMEKIGLVTPTPAHTETPLLFSIIITI